MASKRKHQYHSGSEAKVAFSQARQGARLGAAAGSATAKASLDKLREYRQSNAGTKRRTAIRKLQSDIKAAGGPSKDTAAQLKKVRSLKRTNRTAGLGALGAGGSAVSKSALAAARRRKDVNRRGKGKFTTGARANRYGT